MIINEAIMTQKKLVSKPTCSIHIKLQSQSVDNPVLTAKRANVQSRDKLCINNHKEKCTNESIEPSASILDSAQESNMHGYSEGFHLIEGQESTTRKYNKNICTDYKYIQKTQKDFKGMHLDFIVKNLDNDRRVKKYKLSDTCVIVYFWNLKGSISFYTQYFNHIDMNYQDLKSLDLNFEINKVKDVWKNRDLNNLYYESFIFHELMCVRLMFVTATETPEEPANNQSFEDRVLHFTNLSKYFSPSDLKNIINLVKKCEYDFVFTLTKELCVGVMTNVLMQDVICRLSKYEIEKIIDILGVDIGPISATKHGAYVIQVLISVISTQKSCRMVKDYFNPYIVKLLKHPIGNYAVQKTINFDIQYFIGIFKGNFVELMSNDLGFKVFKKSYGTFEIMNCDFKETLKQYEDQLPQKRREEAEKLILDK